ncbi:Transposable element P transposase, partial [Harpegnathos saltator]
FQVQTFADAEKHAVLIIDEMSIKPGLQYDNSIVAVVGRPTMKLSGGFDSSHQKATHALVFMLYGISTKWKQTIGYEFTGNSFCSQQIVQIMLAIIQKANDIGLKIKVIISDMGAQNRSWWKIMNITVDKYCKINNYIPHPCDNDEKLFVMPDSVHVFKNVACSLTAGNKFYLDETLVRKYDLPHNEISIAPIREVYNLDKNDTLRLCPCLTERAINPSHFEKMHVNLSMQILNNTIAAAISYHVANGRIAEIHETTAWFIKTIHKWFKLMTSRYQKLALSRHNENIYRDTITFLQDFIVIIKGIVVGDGKWK